MKEKLNTYSYFWLISLIGMIAVALVMICNDCCRVHNILEIEFSSTLEIFEGLVGNQKPKVKTNTLVDFIFIAVYSLFFMASLNVAVLSLQTHLKPIFNLLCFVPGIFDVLENYSILNLLADYNVSDFKMLYWTARTKWALVIPFMLVGLTIFLYYTLFALGKFFNRFIK